MKYLLSGLIVFLLLSCSCDKPPVGPDTKPVVVAGRDTTVYVLDTVILHGVALSQDDSIVKYRWNFTNDGTWDDSSAAESTFIFVVPDTACVLTAILEAENTLGEKSRDQVKITVQADSVVARYKRYFGADSTLAVLNVFTYGADGKLLKQSNYSRLDSTRDSLTGYTEFTYNAAGNLSMQTSHKPDGSLSSSQEYQYNGNGRNTVILYQDKNSALIGTDTLAYNTSGKLDRSSHYGADLSLWYYYGYTYNGSSRLTQKTYYSRTGVAGNYTAYEYDAKGRLVKETAYTAAGSLTGYYEYQYSGLHRAMLGKKLV
jgi:YD repeat-containing protein